MAHPDTEIFRENVAELCAEHGQIEETANRAGISRVYLSRIINGHATPTLDIAAKIAEALKKPLPALLKKSGKKLAIAG